MHYWQCLAFVLVYNLHIAMFFVVNVNICLFMCSAFSPNVATMLVGRLLVGGGLGLSGPVTALYVSEVRFTLWFYTIFLQLSFSKGITLISLLFSFMHVQYEYAHLFVHSQ